MHVIFTVTKICGIGFTYSLKFMNTIDKSDIESTFKAIFITKTVQDIGFSKLDWQCKAPLLPYGLLTPSSLKSRSLERRPGAGSLDPGFSTLGGRIRIFCSVFLDSGACS